MKLRTQLETFMKEFEYYVSTRRFRAKSYAYLNQLTFYDDGDSIFVGGKKP